MKLLITFREPGRGFYKMYLSPPEVIRFINGRAKREPPSKNAITNSVPIKYITSIRIVGDKESICPVCKKATTQILCLNCIETAVKSTPVIPAQ